MKRSQELEEAVGDLLTLKGYSFFRVANYRCYNCGAVGNSGAKGMPDFLVFHPRIFAAEVKTGKGVLSKDQKEVKRKMEEAGIPWLTVRDTVDELLKVL